MNQIFNYLVPLVLLAAAAAILAIAVISGQQDSVEYETKIEIQLPNLGSIIGKNTNTAIEFFGIPYAEQPERWRHASYPPKNFGKRDGFIREKSAPICIQDCYDTYDNWVPGCPKYEDGMQDEKCLYLDISVPTRFQEMIKNGKIDGNINKAPVFIYFHGGAFKFGTGQSVLYESKYLSALGDIIVVRVNYRLGIFGFMPMDDVWQGEPSVGNFGLSDQRNAIQFVYDNIKYFGGDNSKITIGGQSAGGESSYLQMMNPGEHQKQFRSAYIMSLPAGLPFLEGEFAKQNIQPAVIDHADRILKERDPSLSCPDLDCLYQLDPLDVFAASKGNTGGFIQNRTHNLLSLFQTYDPVIDKNLVFDQFVNLAKNFNQPGNPLSDKPVMIGHTGDEGEIFVQSVLGEAAEAAEEAFEDWEPTGKLSQPLYNALIKLIWQNPDEIPILKDFYPFTLDCDRFHKNRTFDRECDGKDASNHWVRDTLFTCSQRAILNNLQSNQFSSKTYFWHFADSFPWVPPELNEQFLMSYTRCQSMACHGVDIGSVFALDYLFPFVNFNADAKFLYRNWEAYLINFIRNSDPNDNTRDVIDLSKNDLISSLPGQKNQPELPFWPEFDQENWGYQYLNSKNENMIEYRYHPNITDIHGDDLVNLDGICSYLDEWDSYANH